MLSSSQQANAYGASNYEVGHIEYTQFFTSLHAWRIANIHMYTEERKEDIKKEPRGKA